MSSIIDAVGSKTRDCKYCGRDTRNKSRACTKCMCSSIRIDDDEETGRDFDVAEDVRRVMREMIEWN